jgi:hypothetical protein
VKGVLPLVLLAGCAWRVHVESMPVQAQIELPTDERVVTPRDITMRYVPFGKQKIVIRAKGYRTIETDLRDDEIRSWRYVGTTVRGSRRYGDREEGGGTRGDLRYLLVPEHGPAGTWDAEDVPD